MSDLPFSEGRGMAGEGPSPGLGVLSTYSFLDVTRFLEVT